MLEVGGGGKSLQRADEKVRYNRMRPAPITAELSATAPEMVRRLGLIVAGLAALIARRFLRDPKFGALVGPLWSWLNRSVQRFARLRAVVRVAVRPMPRTRVRRVGTPPVRLPGGQGWLVKALGWEAAGYGCQLTALLAEPEMLALMQALPGVGRVLRPLCRMLLMAKVAVLALPARERPKRPVEPKVAQVKPVRLPKVPRSWWPLRLQKYAQS